MDLGEMQVGEAGLAQGQVRGPCCKPGVESPPGGAETPPGEAPLGSGWPLVTPGTET